MGRYPLRSVISALPDFGLAALFLLTWTAPHVVGVDRIGNLMLVMLLEFIVVHSAAIMGSAALAKGSRRTRLLVIFKFGGFYTLFVGAFALSFRVWWPLWAFWGLTLNRTLGVLVGQAPIGDERRFIKAGWAVGAMCYLGAVFLTSFVPFLPRLGVTRDVVAAADLPGSGLWVDQPHRVLAAGVLYFAAVAVSELHDHRWIPATSLPGESTTSGETIEQGTNDG